jgi:hypothetical protein
MCKKYQAKRKEKKEKQQHKSTTAEHTTEKKHNNLFSLTDVVATIQKYCPINRETTEKTNIKKHSREHSALRF